MKRLLLIDDDQGICELIKRNLLGLELETHFAHTGEVAERLLNQKDFELIIMDYMLQDNNALEIIKNFEKNGIDIPYIVMTGYGDERLAVEVMKAGASDYLVKDNDFMTKLPKIVNSVIKDAEHKRKLMEAEEARKASEQRYRLLFENANEAIIIINKGRIDFANPEFCRLIGQNSEEIDGEEFKKFASHGYRTEVKEYLKSVKPNSNKNGKIKFRMDKDDGTKLWVEMHSISVGADENLTINFINDISKLVATENRLKEAENRSAIIFETTPDCIYIMDLDFKFIDVNPAMAKFLKSERAEIIGKGTIDFLSDEDYLRCHETDQKVLQGEIIDQGLFNFGPDGEGDFDIIKAPLRDAVGEIIGIYGIARDVSEARKYDMEIEKSRERYRRITEAIMDYTYHVEIEAGDVIKTTHSETCVAVTGYSGREFIDDPNLWINMVHPKDRELVQKHSKALIAGQNYGPIEHRIIKKTGELRWVRNTPLLNYDGNGVLTSFEGLIQDITEKHMAQQVMFDSEKKFRLLLEKVSNIAVTGYDKHGEVNFWNRASQDLYGYTRDEAIGRNINELIIPEDLQQNFNEMRQHSIRTGETPEGDEVIMVDKFGNKIDVFNNNVIINFDGGDPLFFSIDVDLRKRKIAEKFLKIQKELGSYLSTTTELSSALKSTIDAIMEVNTVDCAGIYLFNDERNSLDIKETRGLKDENVQLVKSYGPNSRFFGMNKMGQNYEVDGKSSISEFVKNENIRFYLSIPIKSRDIVYGAILIGTRSFDRIPDYCLNPLENIAGELGGVVARIKAEVMLRRSENQYRITINSITDIIFLIDRDFNIQMYNKSFMKALIKYKGEIEAPIGKNVFQISPFIDEKSQGDYYRVMQEKMPLHIEREFKPGKKSIILTTFILPIIENNRVVRIVTAQRDITDSRKMNKQMAQNEKMAALGRLAGGVAHDLNNILSGIISYPELLLMRMDKQDPNTKFVEKMLQSGLRARDTVDDLLTLSRQGLSSKVVVSLNNLVHDYLESPEFNNLKKLRQDIEFNIHLSKELKNIMGSQTHLFKSLMNLVTNGVEAIEGQGSVDIRTYNLRTSQIIKGTTEIPEGEYTVLEVSDSGPGISDEEKTKIFEPFYTKKVMGKSGTGLGLAIVYGTVKDHGGYPIVKNIYPNGTSFQLLFPAIDIPFIQQKAKPKSKYIGENQKILVVDDVSEQRLIARRILQELNYQPSTAESGEHAIEFLESNDVDLVLLDVIMAPGIDGVETYKRIKTFKPNQKVVLVSGFSDIERIKEADNLGIKLFVKKPYMLNELGRAVQRIFESE